MFSERKKGIGTKLWGVKVLGSRFVFSPVKHGALTLILRLQESWFHFLMTTTCVGLQL